MLLLVSFSLPLSLGKSLLAKDSRAREKLALIMPMQPRSKASSDMSIDDTP